jgi:putative phosphoribosyl transferase
MYQDRLAAGTILAEKLADRFFGPLAILAVPRGGIVVAAPIARRLHTRLGILVTRKIGHPANPEVAIGAVMADGSAVLDHDLIERSAISREFLRQAIAAGYGELKRRLLLYTGSEVPAPVAGKTAVIVDDGIATGYTVRAAITWLKTLHPAKIVLAVPVAPPEIIAELIRDVDEIICPLQPAFLTAVGRYYQEFPQNTDAQVLALLEECNKIWS